MNHGDKPEGEAPPDRASAGDVSATGHSTHDAHDAHDAHGGHGDDLSDVPTLVPTRWSQLILPVIILLVVAILVAGPVMNAFSSKPAPPSPAEQSTQGGAGSGSTGAQASPTIELTATPQSEATQPPATATPGNSSDANAPLMATQTAVAIAGEQGEVARIPVRLDFEGASFGVAPGSGLLPDWKPPQDDNSATWIQGTIANHILYVPFSARNQSLFNSAKTGDIIKIAMNTSQVFSFKITRSERAVNGPSTQQGQFTVGAAMAQDHAGVTIFLTGDPAADRAVVQADFTGDIQSALP